MGTELSAYVSTASKTIGELGGAFYFDKATLTVGREHGLDGMRFYMYGRGGVLGDVEPEVVGSAFGYFYPPMVAKLWNTARDRADISPREAGRIYLQCSAELGRREFGDIAGLDQFCETAERVVEAADRAGLVLFAAIAAEPLADDAPGRAMQLVTVLRELRGSAHLIAVRAVGLDPKVAHGVRRPQVWTAFGYDEADLPQVTAEIRALMTESDELTDRIVTPAYAKLENAGRKRLTDGLDAMSARHREVLAAATA